MILRFPFLPLHGGFAFSHSSASSQFFGTTAFASLVEQPSPLESDYESAPASDSELDVELEPALQFVSAVEFVSMSLFVVVSWFESNFYSLLEVDADDIVESKSLVVVPFEPEVALPLQIELEVALI